MERLEAALSNRVKLTGGKQARSFPLGARTLNWQDSRLKPGQVFGTCPAGKRRSDRRPNEPLFAT